MNTDHTQRYKKHLKATKDIMPMATTMHESRATSTSFPYMSRNIEGYQGLVFDDVVADIMLLVEDLHSQTFK